MGTLLPSDDPDRLRLQCPTFADPLEFNIQAFSSIEPTNREVRKVPAEKSFHFAGGTTVAGTLIELDDASVVIDSPCLKNVRLPRAMLHHFSSNNGSSKPVYAGPRGAGEWVGSPNETDWQFEAGTVVNSLAGGTTMFGYVSLPDKSEVRIALSWSSQPDFSLAIGCSKPSKPGGPITAAATLEVWDGRLVLVREGEKLADMVMLADVLSDRQRLELTIYVDQPGGMAAVCTPDGRLLGRLQLGQDNPVRHRLIALSHHGNPADGKFLRLEHCEVREWTGELPIVWPESEPGVLSDDGKLLMGSLGTVAGGQQEIAVAGKDGRLTQVPLKRVQRAVVSTAAEVRRSSTESIAVDLADGTHLIGVWSQQDADQVTFTLEGVGHSVVFSLNDVVGVLGSFERSTSPELTGKVGQLETKTASLKGCLVDCEGEGTLSWHAAAATAPVRLAATSKGKIQYESPRPVATLRALVQQGGQVEWLEAPQAAPGQPWPRIAAPQAIAPRILGGAAPQAAFPPANQAQALQAQAQAQALKAQALQAQALQAQAREALQAQEMRARALQALQAQRLNAAGIAPRVVVPQEIAPGVIVFRENGRISVRPTSALTRIDLEPGLKLREGDQLPGKVLSIDQRGVTFQSPETSTTFLPHDQMDCVILATSRKADTQSPQQRKRLMTVPRSSKSDPPTHLLISVSGDYLRGRLVKLDDKQITMEVRLEQVELATERIAEIHWLHDRQWQEDESDSGSQPPEKPDVPENHKLLVHVVRRNGRPLTFRPIAVSDQTLQGESDLLDDRKVRLADVISLDFGTDLAQPPETPNTAAWKLELATLPKVYQADEDGARESSSPLIGKPAPAFTLETTIGDKCALRTLRGRVLVLDFWASWCGPCMQTMPEVDRIVDEVGGDHVELIAVNLQETKERAQAAAKRLGLSATIALDEDGTVAQQYQAATIPQTVIIDRQGNITHLFIGGGPRFLSEFTEALAEVVKGP